MNVMKTFAVIIISILALLSCFVGIVGIYSLIQIPDRAINFYLIPLFLISGTLLIISLLNCYKESGNILLGFKLGVGSIISIPLIYLIACLDSGRISGLEFMSSIPVILISGLCYWLLRVVVRDNTPDNKSLKFDARKARTS